MLVKKKKRVKNELLCWLLYVKLKQTPSSQSLTTEVHLALLGKELIKASCAARVPKEM